MYRAEVGDDVLGEDPTVNRLEEMAAERMGKEAAVFVASGTMANLVCLLTHCGRGDEFIVGHLAHTFLLEAGASAGLGGLHPHTIHNQPDGTLDLEDVEAAIRADNVHFPRTRLICLENTHNRCGGAALSVEYTHSLCELAHSRHIAVHLDGARIFNAAIALGVDVKELTRSRVLSGRWSAAALTLSPRHGATARWWAAGCVRRALSLPQAWWLWSK
jgi:threonine aldolase